MAYTPLRQKIVDRWLDETGFEFMAPDKGESFTDAIKRNRDWIEMHALQITLNAMKIADDYRRFD